MERRLLARVRRMLREGASPRDAAAAVGVQPSEFEALMREGGAFARLVKQSEAECAAEMERAIVGAAPREWRAADAWLKRRRPAGAAATDAAPAGGASGLRAFDRVVVEQVAEGDSDGGDAVEG